MPRKLVVGALVAVFATTGFAALPQPTLAASYGSCRDGVLVNYFSFVEKESSTKNVRNIKATIQVPSPTTQFRPCTWDLNTDGSSGWVAVEGGSGQILQIGLIACNEYWLSSCDTNTLHYFWAEAGCGLSWPDPQNLGTTNTSAHDYIIRHMSNDYFKLKIDGVVKLSFKDTSHTDISCWITNHTKGAWAFERWDRGDGIGSSAYKSLMWYAWYMWDPGDQGSWLVPNFTWCSATPTGFPGKGYCDFGDDEFLGWSLY